MNKTVTISINSIFFHIDEDAYAILSKYLDSLNKHFAQTEGKEEIMQDIESRISEILQTKISDRKNVIEVSDIEEIISILGKPEDIAGDETEPEKKETKKQEPYRSKKLYRDPDNRILGGVAAGIAWYFNIDPTWIRIAFVLTFFVSSPLVYLIMWIIVPIAQTTSEKLEMRGENVTISNIENSIKEEFEEVKKRMKSYGNEAKEYFKQGKFNNKYPLAERSKDFAENLIFLFVRSIAILTGIILTGVGLAVFVGMIISLFASGSFSAFTISENQTTLQHFLTSIFVNASNLWMSILSIFLIFGIPLLLIIYSGIKLIFGIRKRFKIITWTALSLWICGIALFIYSLTNVGYNFKDNGTSKSYLGINKTNNQTYYLEAVINNKEMEDCLAENICSDANETNNCHQWNIHTDNGLKLLYSLPHLNFKAANSDSATIQMSKFARGKNNKDAKTNAENLNYHIQIKDSTITIDKFAELQNPDLWRNQSVEVTFRLPIGTKIKLGKNLDFLKDCNDFYSENQNINQFNKTWMMTSEGLKCMDCE